MKSVISTLLLTIMLTVTIGVPVFRHTCNVTDRSEVSILTAKQCCDPNQQSSETTIDFQCCSLEHFDTAFDYETLVKTSENISIINVFFEFDSAPEIIFVAGQADELPVLRPPPLANRDLLNKIQHYLI
jgi:hypothetical protein